MVVAVAYLEILNGPHVGQKSAVSSDTFFVGREPTNHMVIPDRSVSRKHAVINNVNKRFIISDLKSLKGILINGEKSSETVLEDGDEITLGATRLRFYAQTGPFPTAVKGPEKRRREFPRGGFLGVGFLLLLAAAGGAYYYLSPKAVRKPTPNGDLGLLEYHYRLGVELYNADGDAEGAKKEWNTVLSLDPQKQHPYTRKAAKLLENIR